LVAEREITECWLVVSDISDALPGWKVAQQFGPIGPQRREQFVNPGSVFPRASGATRRAAG
jgi:hypothetical protein